MTSPQPVPPPEETAYVEQPPPEEQQAEDQLAEAIAVVLLAILAIWLAGAERAVLAGTVPSADLMPEGDDLVQRVTARIRGEVLRLWRVFAPQRDADADVNAYLEGFAHRLSFLPRRVHDAVAAAIGAATQAGRDPRGDVGKALAVSSWQGWASRFGRTEATMAVNAARYEAARRLQADGVRLRKRWVSRQDDRVRPTHRVADGQTVPLSTPFLVGGHHMDHPGDPRAPLSETQGCRCVTEYLRGQ